LPLAGSALGARRQLRDDKTDICGRQTNQALVQIIPERKLNCGCATAVWHDHAGDSDVDFLG
jgi:hypothetical protein